MSTYSQLGDALYSKGNKVNISNGIRGAIKKRRSQNVTDYSASIISATHRPAPPFTNVLTLLNKKAGWQADLSGPIISPQILTAHDNASIPEGSRSRFGAGEHSRIRGDFSGELGVRAHEVRPWHPSDVYAEALTVVFDAIRVVRVYIDSALQKRGAADDPPRAQDASAVRDRRMPIRGNSELHCRGYCEGFGTRHFYRFRKDEFCYAVFDLHAHGAVVADLDAGGFNLGENGRMVALRGSYGQGVISILKKAVQCKEKGGKRRQKNIARGIQELG
jgi:hypothetical protein